MCQFCNFKILQGYSGCVACERNQTLFTEQWLQIGKFTLSRRSQSTTRPRIVGSSFRERSMMSPLSWRNIPEVMRFCCLAPGKMQRMILKTWDTVILQEM
ncbi:hypothetical protein VNO80_18849 [Phaseolus coccineus]|uniref:Uncharacterized protein n=1 Tax=Phaseolus coccineus TaxID=3886 RepID=A0AAN9QZ97_PHACN